MVTTAHGKVKFLVRHNALLLREFTVEQMRRATALNAASIRTELQRMKRQGYLTSHPLQERKRRRGARPHVYTLTDDLEKRLELARSVEAFYAPPPASAPPRPTGLHYQGALELIKRLEADQVPAEERGGWLSRARERLERSRSEEGVGIREGPEAEIVAAHLALLEARLALKSEEWAQAEKLLSEAASIFDRYGLIDEKGQVESFRAALAVEQALAERPWIGELCNRLLSLLRDLPATSLPLGTVCRLLETVHPLVEAAPIVVTVEEAFVRLARSEVLEQGTDSVHHAIDIEPSLALGDEIEFELQERVPPGTFALYSDQLEDDATGYNSFAWDISRPTNRLKLRVLIPTIARPAEGRFEPDVWFAVGPGRVRQPIEYGNVKDKLVGESTGSHFALTLDVPFPKLGLTYAIKWVPPERPD